MSALKICPQCGTEYELDQRFCPKDGSTLRAQSTSEDLIGSIVADRYHIMKKLGEGGMGTVYLAEHVKMGRKSAVKVMNPGMVNDADAISRFNREAANASKINHPNVAAVYDFGETSDGLIYLAMEFIEGPSLTKVIEDAGALEPLRAAEITRQASEALSVAHDMGIVHRDLKPDNIMIAKNRDGSDCVKVVDFGIAKAANSEAQKVTKTGMVVGTPEYMSPEQLAGDKLDGRSDLYSLALVAFNMLTGKLPFVADSAQESMILRLTEQPRTLSEMKADVVWSPEAQRVLDKALSREASGRYASASEFGRDLYRAIDGMSHAKVEAGTAIISAHRAPAAPPAPAAAHVVPPTRLNPSTPAASHPHVPAGGRSKTPYMVAAAAVVIAAVGIGAIAMKGNASRATPAQQGDTAQPSGTKAIPPAPAAAVDVDAELAAIRKLTDQRTGDSSTAAQALTRLASLPEAGMKREQRVLAHLETAEAHALQGNARAACNAVQDVEGASKGTVYERGVAVILQNACSP